MTPSSGRVRKLHTLVGAGTVAWLWSYAGEVATHSDAVSRDSFSNSEKMVATRMVSEPGRARRETHPGRRLTAKLESQDLVDSSIR